MGCGWMADPPADMNLLDAVEAVNGGSETPAQSGIPFWEHQLDLGYRPTAIGGSDNHRPMRPADEPGAVGSPTTVVYAENLSTPAILAGIRAGHVFIDLTGSRNRMLDLMATCNSQIARIGDELGAPEGARVAFEARTAGVTGGRVELVEDGKTVPSVASDASQDASEVARDIWTSDGGRHWFLAEEFGPDGKVRLLGNPVYVNWPKHP